MDRSLQAYLSVCESDVKAGVRLFYALAGAIEGGHWREVDRAGLLLLD